MHGTRISAAFLKMHDTRISCIYSYVLLGHQQHLSRCQTWTTKEGLDLQKRIRISCVYVFIYIHLSIYTYKYKQKIFFQKYFSLHMYIFVYIFIHVYMNAYIYLCAYIIIHKQI